MVVEPADAGRYDPPGSGPGFASTAAPATGTPFTSSTTPATGTSFTPSTTPATGTTFTPVIARGSGTAVGPGSGPAFGRTARVVRFSATERHLHTIHVVAFLVMLATGLVLYVPSIAVIFSDRPLVKAIHLLAAVAWLTALALLPILGDRRALRRTRQELERFDADDLRWLRRRPSAPGRFNAGQKAHAIAQAALAVLFTVSGLLLWLGERNADLRLPGTIALHDASMIVAGFLVAGHIWIALSPGKLPSLEGILRGTVPAAWAAEHHPRWPAPAAGADRPAARLGPARLAAALVVLALGVAAAAVVAGVA